MSNTRLEEIKQKAEWMEKEKKNCEKYGIQYECEYELDALNFLLQELEKVQEKVTGLEEYIQIQVTNLSTVKMRESNLEGKLVNIQQENERIQGEYAEKWAECNGWKARAENAEQENERYKEGYEVLSSKELILHPSEVRDFAKQILKGKTPYKLNEAGNE